VGSLTQFDLGALIAKYGLLHFVETGTGRGESLAHAARFMFRTLCSCEVEPSLADAASKAFESDSRITVHRVDSETFLSVVCDLIPREEPILFWLDAHFPGADYGLKGYGAETDPARRLPLSRELSILSGLRGCRDVVIADDLRIWLDGAFGHGNAPAGIRHLLPRRRDAGFFADILGATHAVSFDYRHEGYAVMTPLDVAPPTLLGADTLATLLRLAKSAPKGDFVEVGVYKGGTAWHLSRLAKTRGCRLHLFDTFEGIPERDVEDDVHGIGDFADVSLDAVRTAVPDAEYHAGVFPATMPESFGPVAFVHVDCDQYRCAAAVIERFMPLLVEGGTMLFDDYDATAGVRKAVDDALGGRIELTAQGKAYFVKETVCV
jgi:hypothetical protein